MKHEPNLYCHAFPADWEECHAVQLRISKQKRKELDKIPKGEDNIRRGIVAFNSISRKYWAVRHFPCFIGKSKPPEPHEIRVARNIGWKQCDYPHKQAKSMWYHPDCPLCSDGKYIDTEEMLDFIKEERDKHNAGVNAACSIKP